MFLIDSGGHINAKLSCQKRTHVVYENHRKHGAQCKLKMPCGFGLLEFFVSFFYS